MTDKKKIPEQSTNHNKIFRNKWSIIRLSKKAKIIGLVIILLLVVFGALYFMLRQDSVQVGDTKITQSDIDEYAEYAKKLKEDIPSIVRDVSDKEDAINRLVMNAALKAEAKEAGVSLSDDDLNQVVMKEFATNAEKKAFFDSYRTPDRKNELINLENQAYKMKLSDKLLIKKNFVAVNIMYDTPYFKQLKTSDAEAQYVQSKKRLKEEMIPLLKSGASKEEIAKHVDTIWYGDKDDGNQDLFLYMSKPAMAIDTIDNYQKGVTTFNDLDDTSFINGDIGKLDGTAAKLDELQKVGDVSDVFTSKAGTFMVARLDSKTNGKYDSWESMLDIYKKKHVSGKLKALIRDAKTTASNTLDFAAKTITSPGLDNAWAAIDDSICRGHFAKFTVVAVDMVKDERLQGAKISMTRKATDRVGKDGAKVGPADTCGSVGTFTAVSDGSAQPTEGSWSRYGGDGNENDRTIHDSCWNTPPEWNVVAHPAKYGTPGYTASDPGEPYPLGHDANVYKTKDAPANIYDMRNNSNSGWPTWNSANTNESSYWIVLKYRTLPPLPDEEETKASPICTTFGHTMAAKSYYHFVFFARGTNVSPPEPPAAPAGSNNQLTGTLWNELQGGQGYQFEDRGIDNRDSTKTKAYTKGFPAQPNDENWRGWRVIAERWTQTPSGSWVYASEKIDLECPIWVLSPSSSSAASYVEQGNSVVFNHSITNSGNTPATGFTRCAILKYNPYDISSGSITGESCADGHANGGGGQPIAAGGAYAVADNPFSTLSTNGSTPLGTRYCQAYSVSRGSSLPNATARNSTEACTTVVGGKTGVSITSDQGSVEPTETKTFTIDVDTNNFVGHPDWPGYNAGCTYTVTGGSSNSSGDCSASVTDDGNNRKVTGAYTATQGDVGKQICIKADLSITNPNFYQSGAQSAQHCFRVITRPYIQAFAGDVSVGCQGSNASILSWNRNGGAGFAGAGGSYAVYAYNKILGFAAGQNIPAAEGYGTAPANLAFGNTETAAIGSGSYINGTYGGGYVDNCTSDYYDTKPADVAEWKGMSSMALSINKNFSAPGSVTINGGQVRIATNARLYVNGDVYIGGNITAQPGTVENLAHVPNFTIIAKGNIYIGANVTSLYGGYVAGNQIVTCANSNYTPKLLASANTYNECRTPLTVTGSLTAKKIHFLRTNGSLLANQPAEVVKYNPLASFMQSATKNTENNAAYDAITTLPPVL